MAHGEGGAGGEGNGSIMWSIVWFLILIFLGFWLAGTCAFLYIIISMFAACFEAVQPVCDLLLKGVQFTGLCAKCMIKGTPVAEAFN